MLISCETDPTIFLASIVNFPEWTDGLSFGMVKE